MPLQTLAELAHQVGAVIPFADTKLKFTRVRRGQDGLEALLPSLVGGRETYVVQLIDLPRLFPLPLYDRMLLEEIVAEGALSPSALRRAALALDAEGARGAVARQEAQARLAMDRTQEISAYFAALERLRDLLVPSLPPWEVETYDLRERETNLRVNTLVEAAAHRFGQDKRMVVALLERMARVLSPLMDFQVSQGHLASALYAVRSFVSDLARMRLGGSAEGQEVLSFVRMAGRETDRLVTPLLRQGQGMLQAVDAFLQRPDDMEGALSELVQTVEWSLDGWTSLIDHWQTVDERTQLAAATLDQIAPNVPFLPLQVFATGSRDRGTALERGRASLTGLTRTVAAGEVDTVSLDLMRRRRAG
ncbi:hypothetical protein [Rhodocista pekingensis]|uniref:Uncharacterized protein n=1 Tax=Rhodocista pekingensis TaxID=201185 RepID=A0ABW2L0T8_9PROT